VRGLALVLFACLGLTACGGSSPTATTMTGATTPGPASTTPTGDPKAAVVKRWADTLRGGDVNGAAAIFGLPAVVQVDPNGPYATLRSTADARSFNAALPCGARLVKVTERGGLTIGTFRLTQRPGARCDGPGALARTAFVIEGDRITHWLRLPDPPPSGGGSATTPDQPLV
jgi:hypothetical protein